MLSLFRLIYWVAASLCLAAALLVTASLFIADRAPTSLQFLGISIAVSAVFLLVGLMIAGIRSRVTRIAHAALAAKGEARAELNREVTALLIYLVAGGSLTCAFMASLTYAILARIDQGFAVFG